MKRRLALAALVSSLLVLASHPALAGPGNMGL